jgi:hypothetical protein
MIRFGIALGITTVLTGILVGCGGGAQEGTGAQTAAQTETVAQTETLAEPVAPSETGAVPEPAPAEELTEAEARAAAQNLDSLIAAVPRDETVARVQDCLNPAFDSGDVDRVAACADVCTEAAGQCRGDAQAVQAAFDSSPEYVQDAYRAATTAAVQALKDRARWNDRVGEFAAGFPTSSGAEDEQSIEEINQLADRAIASRDAVAPALDAARAAFEDYVNQLAPPAEEPVPTTEPAPPAEAGAGASVEGTVTFQGAPAAGVAVILGELSTTTDANGRFVFEDVPADRYLLGVADAGGICLASLTAVTLEAGEQLTQDIAFDVC